MIISKISQDKSSHLWVLFHLALGVICTISRIPLIVWFYLVLASSIPLLFADSPQRRALNILKLATYLSSIELISRMVYCAPIIPHELSKYILIILAVSGIISGSSRGSIGIVLVLLLLPALFFDNSGMVNGLGPYVFNAFGPLSLAFLVIFAWRLPCSFEDFKNLLRLLVYFPLSVLTYCYIRTPDYDEMSYRLGANFEASGGYGANQVSTILGLGMLLVFIFWLNRWKLSGYRSIDAIILFAFAFQGLLTFSRGGMLAGALGIVTMLLLVSTSTIKSKASLKGIRTAKKYALPALIISAGAYIIADSLTGGRLSLRYSGQTENSLITGEQVSLGKLTTGRYDIFIGDIALWADHPILGVGIGASRYMRQTFNDVVAHVELSRLLAEHGLLGFLYFVILLLMPISTSRFQRDPISRSILVSLVVIAIFTTFHAAIRTYVTPLLIGLSVINIQQTGYTSAKQAAANMPTKVDKFDGQSIQKN